MSKTLFDKIWDAHVVSAVENGPTQLYIDRHFCHEVTSPQAFNGLRERGLSVLRPDLTTMTADHNTPTIDQDKPVQDPISRNQLDTFAKNAAEFKMPLFYPLGHDKNGVVQPIFHRYVNLTTPLKSLSTADQTSQLEGISRAGQKYV